MKTFLIIVLSFVLLGLIGLAISIWFIPLTMWGVGAAGVAIRVVMPTVAQIFLKGFVTIGLAFVASIIVWVIREFFEIF